MILKIIIFSYSLLAIPDGEFKVICNGKEIRPLIKGWIRNLKVGIFDIPEIKSLKIEGEKGNGSFNKNFKDVLEKIILNKEDIDRFSYRIDLILDNPQIPFNHAIKIYTKEEGVYRIYGNMLRRIGIDIDTLNPKKAHLFYRGREVPFYFYGEEDEVFNDGDYIEFIAEKLTGEKTFHHPYTDFNSYFLYFDLENGLRFINKNLVPFDSLKVIKYFLKKYHFEKDSIFMDFTKMRMENTDSLDLWYWKIISFQKPETISFKIENPDTGSLFKFKFYFETFETQDVPFPKHKTLIKINEIFEDTFIWEDNLPYIDSIFIPGKFLKSGNNYLILKEDSTFSNISSILNFFEIEGNFSPEILSHFYKIYPFSDTFSIVLKKGRKKEVSLYFYPSIKFGKIRGNFKEGYYEYKITLESFPSGYYLIADTFFIPEKIEFYEKEEIINPSGGADIVIITPEEFYQKCLIYKNYRESEGYRVKIVKISDIYNQFSYGIKEPEAIREFLKNAIIKWNPSPFVVILFGDASYDPKNIENECIDFIPTYLYPAKAPGQAVYYSRPASSDIYYTLLIGDDPFPDILLGRIPVNSLNECDIFLNKLIEYEKNPEYGWWRISPYFLTEVHEQDGKIFYDACKKLKEENCLSYLDSRIITLSTVPNFKGYTFPEILTELSKGSLVITFIGHASTTFRTIFRNKTFKAERWYDVYNFRKLPFFIGMSCWVGDFAGFSEKYAPETGKSFLEIPLFLSQRGIIGYAGVTASSPSPEYGNYKNITYLLPEGFLKGFFKEGIKRLGEIHLFSRLHTLLYIPYLEGESKNVYYTFNLIGDPLLKLPLPEKESLQVFPNTLLPNDSLFIYSYPYNIPYGKALERIKVSHQDTGIVFYKFKNYNLLPFVDTAIINYSGINSKGEVRIYFYNPSLKKEGTGFSNFSLNGAFVENVEFIPPLLIDTPFHYVKSIIKSVRNIDTIFLLWNYGDSISNPIFINLERIHDTFLTQIPIGPLYPGNNFSICFYIKDTSGIIFYTDTFTYKVPELADLKGGKISILPFIKDKNLKLIFPIINGGERDAENFKYIFKIIKNDDTIFSRIDSMSLKASFNDTLFLDLKDFIYFGKLKIYYNLDFDNKIPESNENNNSLIIEIENPYIFVKDSTEWISFEDSSYFKIRSDTGIFEFKIRKDFLKNPGIYFIDTLSGIIIENLMNKKDFEILFKIHSISDTTFLFIFSKNDSLWHKIEGIDGNDFSLWRVEESGIFSFGYIKDKRGPLIKCLLNGEEIEENAKIKKGMSLDFVFSDSSGIDLFYEKPEILLDGIDIFDSLNFNKGIQNPKMVSSSYKLKNLKEGIHALEIKIYDCLGNLSSKTISFFIFEPFDIILKGIYPNPARKDKVVIVFENTKELESIKIKILTVSGREIYEFDPYQDPIRPPLTRKGIHWVEWFLNDKFGNKVSNGVYILYIEGKWGNKIKRIIEKIAVLR